MKILRCLVTLVATLICIHAGLASAKTIHVQPWGVPAPGCGSKVTPCVSITSALTIAARNDRIIVGPGAYEGHYNITVEGLRLESAEGPHATILRPTNPAANIIVVLNHKVRIGRRGKGFTIGHTTIPAAGVRVATNFDGARVEGNVLEGNYRGIWLTGNKPVARHNLVLDSEDAGIYLHTASSAMVSDNRVFQYEGDGGNGIFLFNSTRTSVQNNLVSGAHIGIHVRPDSSDSRILANVVRRGQGLGNTAIGTLNVNGLLTDGNISSQNHWGFYLRNEVTQTSPAVFRNNAAIDSGSVAYGFTTLNIAGPQFLVRFDNNTGVSTGEFGTGLRLEFQAGISSAQGNNLYDHGSFAIDSFAGSSALLKKTYFGLVNGTPSSAYSGTNGNIDPATISTEAAKPNRFRARKAAKLM